MHADGAMGEQLYIRHVKYNNWRYELVQLYITITYYNIVTKSINYRYIDFIFK